MNLLQITEAQLKRTCEGYLQLLQNQGKLLFLRLNAGSFILTDKDGNFRRRVQGAKAGTADYILIRSAPGEKSESIHRLVDFIELKSTKGKTSKVQDDFAAFVRSQGCGYFVIRSLEKLQ